MVTPLRSVALNHWYAITNLNQMEDILLQENDNYHIYRIINMRKWIIDWNILNEMELFMKLTESNYHECLKSNEYTWDDWLKILIKWKIFCFRDSETECWNHHIALNSTGVSHDFETSRDLTMRIYIHIHIHIHIHIRTYVCMYRLFIYCANTL